MSKEAIDIINGRISAYEKANEDLKRANNPESEWTNSCIIEELNMLKALICPAHENYSTPEWIVGKTFEIKIDCSFMPDHNYVRKNVYWNECLACGTLKPIAP